MIPAPDSGFPVTCCSAPDLSFASKARLKKILRAPDKFLSGAPDLAVEVLIRQIESRKFIASLDLYFEYGTRLIWIVNWKLEQVHIYRPDSIEALTRPDGYTGPAMKFCLGLSAVSIKYFPGFVR
jgi:Uma2 family endonuclease